MIQVNAKAPTRVDLGGGTLDMTMLHQILDHKTTVNVAVSVEAEVEVTTSGTDCFEVISEDQNLRLNGSFAEVTASQSLPLVGLLLRHLWKPDLPPLRILSRAQSPAGAGMGGSSCLSIVLTGALAKARGLVESFRFDDDYALVEFVKDIETYLIRVPTGCQDYWGAVRGGVNIISFPPGGAVVKTLESTDIPEQLGERMVLCYSGKSRASATNNWQIFKKAFEGDGEIIRKLNRIGVLAESLARHMIAGDLEAALHDSLQEWQVRREIWPDIVTVETLRLEKAAAQAGADFSRVCGAGGGGVMAIFTPPTRRSAVVTALKNAGGVILSGGPTRQGLRVNGQ